MTETIRGAVLLEPDEVEWQDDQIRYGYPGIVDARRRPGVDSIVLTIEELQAVDPTEVVAVLREVAAHPECEVSAVPDINQAPGREALRVTRRGPLRVTVCDPRVLLPRIARRPGTSFRVHVAEPGDVDPASWRPFTGIAPGSVRVTGSTLFGSGFSNA